MGIFGALHMLTFSLTIAFDKCVEAGFLLRCGPHTKRVLTSALLHFLSGVCAASLQRSPISNLSFPVAIVKSPILECPVFPTAHFPPASASLWLPPISALPISPLCCIVLPASFPPYHLQWKSNGLIPAPAGSPPPHL